MNEQPPLVYHTYYDEFTGANAAEVVDKIYTSAKSTLEVSKEEWWQYQQKVWKRMENKIIPDMAAPDAAQRLLDVLIEVRALQRGPKPAKDIAPEEPHPGRSSAAR